MNLKKLEKNKKMESKLKRIKLKKNLSLIMLFTWKNNSRLQKIKLKNIKSYQKRMDMMINQQKKYRS